MVLAAPLALGLLLSAPALRVELVASEGPCRAEALLGAVRERRPEAAAGGTEAAQPGDLRAVVTAAEPWVLTVHDGEKVILRRDLPPPGEDCAALAETAALMLDRFLDEIDWSPEAAPLGPLPPEPPRERLHGAAAVSFALVPGLGTAVQPALGAVFAVRRGPWRGEVSADVSLGERDPVDPSDSGAGGFDVTVRAGRAFPLGAGELLLGAAAASDILFVSATGPRIFHARSTSAGLAGGGLTAGYQVGFSGFVLGARADLLLMGGSAQFGVEGYPQTLVTHRLDWRFSLSVARQIF
jgi:hypothetical protein